MSAKNRPTKLAAALVGGFFAIQTVLIEGATGNEVNLPEWSIFGDCRVAANRWRQIGASRWQTTVKCSSFRQQDDQLAIDCGHGTYAKLEKSIIIFPGQKDRWSDWRLADGDYLLIMKNYCPNPVTTYRNSKQATN